jgi:glycosyltransferase involved in cell wall biosynthesis
VSVAVPSDAAGNAVADRPRDATGAGRGPARPERTVLLVAFHFPPATGSSGVQRATRFAQYLPAFGWRPIVLTVAPWALEMRDPVDRTPEGVTVLRAPCLDVGRHLSIGGRYPRRLALPDRWSSWSWLGTRLGVRACREHRIDAIWSTYPIASAHVLAGRIAARTGLPWIADFRDPMCDDSYPPEPVRRAAFERVEAGTFAAADRVTVVTSAMQRWYRERYPNFDPRRVELLENGFDPLEFEALDGLAPSDRGERPLVLLHSGVVYPQERDPEPLFEALGRLARRGVLERGRVVLRFRAAGHEALLASLTERCGLQGIVELAPAVPYRDALREMMTVDGLLLMQGESCRDQVPAKAYEYLRASRPILGLADPSSATGGLLAGLGVPYVTPLESADGIERAVPDFLDALRRDAAFVVPRSSVERYSRRDATGRLGAMLDALVERRPA